MNNRDNNNKRFESYPKPTETDNQLKNQPEFIDNNEEDVEDSDVAKTSASNKEKPESEDHSSNDE